MQFIVTSLSFLILLIWVFYLFPWWVYLKVYQFCLSSERTSSHFHWSFLIFFTSISFILSIFWYIGSPNSFAPPHAPLVTLALQLICWKNWSNRLLTTWILLIESLWCLLLVLHLWISYRLKVKALISFYCLRHPVCGILLRQTYETSTVGIWVLYRKC